MDWKRIESVIRRTALPMIVTEGVEEPLIIMPLATYENLIQASESITEKDVMERKDKIQEEEVVVVKNEVTGAGESLVQELMKTDEEYIINSRSVDVTESSEAFSGFLKADDAERMAKISELSASERSLFQW